MQVKYYMSKDLITVSKETKVLTALDLMEKNHIHRLPVVENDKMIGLVTEGVIERNLPSKLTSLSVYEMNYLLTKTNVVDIMLTDIYTIQPEAFLEDAANLMKEHHISVLPVLSDKKELVGIMTENDLFAAFLDISGYYDKGCRIVLNIPVDHTGILADITKLFATEKINIQQLVVYRKTGNPQVVMHVASTDEEKIREILLSQFYDIVICTVIA